MDGKKNLILVLVMAFFAVGIALFLSNYEPLLEIASPPPETEYYSANLINNEYAERMSTLQEANQNEAKEPIVLPGPNDDSPICYITYDGKLVHVLAERREDSESDKLLRLLSKCANLAVVDDKLSVEDAVLVDGPDIESPFCLIIDDRQKSYLEIMMEPTIPGQLDYAFVALLHEYGALLINTDNLQKIPEAETEKIDEIPPMASLHYSYTITN